MVRGPSPKGPQAWRSLIPRPPLRQAHAWPRPRPWPWPWAWHPPPTPGAQGVKHQGGRQGAELRQKAWQGRRHAARCYTLLLLLSCGSPLLLRLLALGGRKGVLVMASGGQDAWRER